MVDFCEFEHPQATLLEMLYAKPELRVRAASVFVADGR